MDDESLLLNVDNLSWTPDGAEMPLWEGVTFGVEAGDTVILRGESGSGKSTLLRSVVYLEKPSSGTVYWRGREVEPGNIRSFRHHVVYVHQTPVAIATTVDEEMAFAREMSSQWAGESSPEPDKDDQQRLLDRFGLGGLDWTRRVDELSVGERQRVALVRCLSVRPEVLLLDEPTASLDETNALRVEDFITEYIGDAPRARAAVWVTHSSEQRRRLRGRAVDIDDFRT